MPISRLEKGRDALEALARVNPQGTVLVVEDDEPVQKLLRVMLQRAGYQVVLAGDGHAALARLAEAVPDLIVSDVKMPGLNGLELLTTLRADPLTRAIPVILLTARNRTEDVVEGLGLGADDYLAKPFNSGELLARVRAKMERPPVPLELLAHDRQTGLLAERPMTNAVRREVERTARGGAPGCVAYLSLNELPQLRERFGHRAEAQIAKQVAALVQAEARPLDATGRDAAGHFVLLLPEITPDAARQRLSTLARRIVTRVFDASGERIRLTPTIGFVAYNSTAHAERLRAQALAAVTAAAARLDLEPVRYEPSMDTAIAPRGALRRFLSTLRRHIALPLQLAFSLGVTGVLPFLIYTMFAAIGADITHLMYFVVVITLLVTAYFIWVEGVLALRPVEIPEEPYRPHPPATAIIAAYLPNEAATIVETVEAFLRLEYSGPLQVICAYNTPHDLPVEGLLQEIALRDVRFLPMRVQGSTSKAQNINAALAATRGEFVGVFDADHHPAPDSFTRAWQWIAAGNDVVQGHCVIRNGVESWVSRTVAVEFESIYGVSHPGRARLHNFGLFGGSNGYWRTDLLRQTRMHGFMLTEDIDSSMRVVEEGYTIVSDPYLISTEQAPVTLRVLWNQRLRWAQGWFQVSYKHLGRALRSPRLSFRQKLGMVHLLGWREIYPFLSFQMFPILAFWLWRGDSLFRFVPTYVLISIFTLCTGPGQTFFAYLLAPPELRRRKSWFLWYLLIASVFYTPFKNLITMVAQAKEMMRERQWKVTPRAASRTPQQ